MAIAIGQQLGSYEITALLGKGGMGEVYRAHDLRLNRDVAIKVVSPLFSTDPDRLRRFEQEARAAAALTHPNILAVFHLGTHDGALYLVSELLEGETFREHLSQGPLPTRNAVNYAVQIAHGLAAAHDKGIFHRDLKPENLFLTKDGRVKILDFGLAKMSVLDSNASTVPMTRQGIEAGPMGTLGYMSPEQVRGKFVDHRSDIFSFGVVLYEMLTGGRAFTADNSAEIIAAILTRDPEDVSVRNSAIPPILGKIVRRCLEKDANHRFHSIRDLAFSLEAIWDGSPPVATIDERDIRVETNARFKGFRTRWTIAVGAAALAILAAVIAGIIFLRPNPSILTERDLILLSDFVNTTGDAAFDETLKQAITVQLEQSPFLNVFPDDRIRQTLRYMAHSPDERVTSDRCAGDLST